MNTDTQTITHELRRGLEAHYGRRVKDVTLFGSQARGEAVTGSDIDVALVLDDFASAGEELSTLSGLVAGLSLKHGCVISIVPIRERDWRRSLTPLLINIRREGVSIV